MWLRRRLTASEAAHRRPDRHQRPDPGHHREEHLAAEPGQRGDGPEQRGEDDRDDPEPDPLDHRARRVVLRPVGIRLGARIPARHPLAQSRQARKRSPAIGEAFTSPPPEFSTRTAIATCGSSYGAKPMNQEWGDLPGSSSAVPDLPATGSPRTAAPAVKRRPRSPLTARRIAAPISPAIPGDITRRQTDGPIVVVPALPLASSTSCGRIRTPSFATAAATSAIWSGVTRVSPWP